METLKKLTMILIILASLVFIFKTSIDIYEYYKPKVHFKGF